MSETKVKIPLPRWWCTSNLRPDFDGLAVDSERVKELERAYIEACRDRDEARADKRRILDNFVACELKYKRQDLALEIAMAEIVRLGGGKQ